MMCWTRAACACAIPVGARLAWSCRNLHFLLTGTAGTRKIRQTDYAHVLAELKAWIEGEDMIGGGEDGSIEEADEMDAELRGLEAAAATAAAATQAARAYPAAAALEQLQAMRADADTLAARLEEAHAAAAEARAAAAAATAEARMLKGKLDDAHATLQRREGRKLEVAQLRSQLNEAAPALEQVRVCVCVAAMLGASEGDALGAIEGDVLDACEGRSPRALRRHHAGSQRGDAPVAFGVPEFPLRRRGME